MANGTRCDGAMVGGMEGSTSRCCNPSSVPKSPSNTSRSSSMISWVVCCFVLAILAAATFPKFFSCTVRALFVQVHLLYYCCTRQWGQILVDNNELDWVFFPISWIAYGHATDSFRCKFSIIPQLQNTFRQVDIFFVDVLDRQNINGYTTINMELNELFIDKHLCVNFGFRDTVDSACHLWLWGHPIKEFYLAGFAFF